MQDRFIILFAGAIGSSKTPIAHYLSCKLTLPIFSNDAIRTEIIEDLGRFDNTQYKKRRDNRLKEILESGSSFIYDASVDREWLNLKQKIKNYKVFVISLDLSKELLFSLCKLKGYYKTLSRIESLMSDHKKFLKQHADVVNLHLIDKDFKNRLELSYKKVKRWLD